MYLHPALNRNPTPYVVVSNPGTDDEDIIADFATLTAAARFRRTWGEPADIMRRRDDGTLTTEI